MQVSKFEKIVASEDIVSSKSIYSVNGVYSSDQICGESICSGGDIHATATISSDCLFAWNTIASQVGNISTASGNIIASAGRVEASNLCSNGVVHSDGLICGANLGTSGNVDVGGNIIANDNIYACSGIHADGLICGGNICSNGVVYADGLVCGSILGAACALRACEVYTSYNITTGHGDIFAQGGRITANSHITSCYGDIKAQNGLVCGTDLGATGNISAGGNSTARNMLASCVCGTHVWGTLFHAVVNVCSLDSIHADGLIRGANLCSNGVVCGTLICGSNISTFGIICAGAEIKSVTDICANQNVTAGGLVCGQNIAAGIKLCAHDLGITGGSIIVSTGNVTASGLIKGLDLCATCGLMVTGSAIANEWLCSGNGISTNGIVQGANLCSNGNVCANNLIHGENLCSDGVVYADGDIVAGGKINSLGNICVAPGACIISEFIMSEDVVCAASAILTNGIVCIGGSGRIDVHGTGSIIVSGTGSICSAGVVCAGSLYGSGVGIDDLIANQVLADPYSDASSSSGQPFTVQNAIEDLDTRLDEFETIAGVSGSGGTICVCNGIVVGVSA